MPRKKRRVRKRAEPLVRFVNITNVSAGVSFGAGQETGSEPHITSYARIALTGELDEPIRDTRNIEIVLYPADDPTPGAVPPSWIGIIHGVRPAVRPAVFVPHRDFERVWSLAMSGLLKHARIALTEPRYNAAEVLNMSFSTHREE